MAGMEGVRPGWEDWPRVEFSGDILGWGSLVARKGFMIVDRPGLPIWLVLPPLLIADAALAAGAVWLIAHLPWGTWDRACFWVAAGAVLGALFAHMMMAWPLLIRRRRHHELSAADYNVVQMTKKLTSRLQAEFDTVRDDELASMADIGLAAVYGNEQVVSVRRIRGKSRPLGPPTTFSVCFKDAREAAKFVSVFEGRGAG